MQAGAAAGACGLVLCAAGTARAVTAPDPSVLSALVGADVGTLAAMTSGVVCNNHLADFSYKSSHARSPHPCVNGPVHSGNSVDSGNFVNRGNPNGSGNIANMNGSTNSGNDVRGTTAASGNTVQKAAGRHR